MTIQILCERTAGAALSCPLSQETTHELAGYIVGFYESLFAGAAPNYPSSKPEFVYQVLRDGYALEEVPIDMTSEAFVLSDQIAPAKDLQALHKRFHDKFAWKLITTTFTQMA